MAKKTQRNKLEEYFEWWLNEMKEYGYIKKWTREPETIIVGEAIEYGRYKRFKTKEKLIEAFNLFGKITYTYDYRIYWDASAEYLFYEEINNSRVFQFGKPLFVEGMCEGSFGVKARDLRGRNARPDVGQGAIGTDGLLRKSPNR